MEIPNNNGKSINESVTVVISTASFGETISLYKHNIEWRMNPMVQRRTTVFFQTIFLIFNSMNFIQEFQINYALFVYTTIPPTKDDVAVPRMSHAYLSSYI